MRARFPRLQQFLLLATVCAGLLALRPVDVHVQNRAAAPRAGTDASTAFGTRIAQLSERAGYFDTDNLISNEKSYLHVMGALRKSGLSGGAYVGVGPDQNFSYIAQLRPDVAFIVDIRRDNLLLQLLFKALFSLSETRTDYLSQLFGRAVPPRLDEWKPADLEAILKYIDNSSPDPARTAALRARVDDRIKRFGVPLSSEDMATIDRFHRTFITAGLNLQFQSTGRAPREYYPDYRELLLETDRLGRRTSFVASEDAFQAVRSLEQRDRIIPVVGDLGGPSAIVNIGKTMSAENLRLSAYYVSNVEFYLFNDGRFGRFIDNLSRLPHNDKSLIIRSIFTGIGPRVPGYYSASIVQRVDDLLTGYSAGRFRNYRDIATVPQPE
jgi:hypothetical protein